MGSTQPHPARERRASEKRSKRGVSRNEKSINLRLKEGGGPQRSRAKECNRGGGGVAFRRTPPPAEKRKGKKKIWHYIQQFTSRGKRRGEGQRKEGKNRAK